MSTITREIIEDIAGLSRLRFSEDEKDTFTEQFAKIVEYFDKLAEVDTDGVEPLTTVMEYGNVLRDDVVEEPLPTKEALRNAPKHNEVFIKVPKVLG